MIFHLWILWLLTPSDTSSQGGACVVPSASTSAAWHTGCPVAARAPLKNCQLPAGKNLVEVLWTSPRGDGSARHSALSSACARTTCPQCITLNPTIQVFVTNVRTASPGFATGHITTQQARLWDLPWLNKFAKCSDYSGPAESAGARHSEDIQIVGDFLLIACCKDDLWRPVTSSPSSPAWKRWTFHGSKGQTVRLNHLHRPCNPWTCCTS